MKRIGVMLRAMDERQGIGIYSTNLIDKLLAIDQTNEYVLFYGNPSFYGRYAQYNNVKETVVPVRNKALWDQIIIPGMAKRENLDLLFHTKFTVPFLANCKTVMTIHGASWFVHPHLYKRLDIMYIRAMMPLYCRKADLILSNSQLTTNDFVQLLHVPREKIRTIPLGTDNSFRVIEDQSALERIKAKYRLPEKFILSVIKHDPRKNFKNLIAAFRILRARIPCKLVVIGIGCEKYIDEYRLRDDRICDDVLFTGWVEHTELPAFYNLATCMFFPSVYEEFGIPSCEAMACGCPPVVSNTGALPENVGDAGITVDPFKPKEMADALEKLYNDESLRAEYAAKCLVRAKYFTWERCAGDTLEALHSI
ncbi:MAG: glycosyltransferase family 4 protein [Lentisphaerae bacterium]|nr:glycosyltransferase family 4 protein [Lentisphaerota bacterium]